MTRVCKITEVFALFAFRWQPVGAGNPCYRALWISVTASLIALYSNLVLLTALVELEVLTVHVCVCLRSLPAIASFRPLYSNPIILTVWVKLNLVKLSSCACDVTAGGCFIRAFLKWHGCVESLYETWSASSVDECVWSPPVMVSLTAVEGVRGMCLMHESLLNNRHHLSTCWQLFSSAWNELYCWRRLFNWQLSLSNFVYIRPLVKLSAHMKVQVNSVCVCVCCVCACACVYVCTRMCMNACVQMRMHVCVCVCVCVCVRKVTANAGYQATNGVDTVIYSCTTPLLVWWPTNRGIQDSVCCWLF